MANPKTAVFPGAVATDAELVPVTSSYQAVLVGDVDSTQTSIAVSTIQNGFGADVTLPIILRIDNELIYAPTRSGNTFTGCTRDMFDTVAAAHATNASVYGNLNADVINQAFAELKAIEDYLDTLSLPSSGSFLYSTGNITVPPGTTKGMFRLQGAGGGGAGGGASNAGGGGGAGEVKDIYLTGLTPGGTITVAYGAAGTAGAANNSGVAGGDTSISGAGISGTITARGGFQGPDPDVSKDGGAGGNPNATGGTGTTPPKEAGLCGGGGQSSQTVGTDAYRGAGMNSVYTAGGFGAASAGVYRGGGGGGCPNGIPGYPSNEASGASSDMDALPGSGFGAGGGGGSRDNSFDRRGAGSDGQPGCVVVQWN